MEAFGRWKLEGTERMVHIARIEARIRGGDGVGLAPQHFAVTHPGRLFLAQVLDSRPLGAHTSHDATLTDSFGAFGSFGSFGAFGSFGSFNSFSFVILPS